MGAEGMPYLDTLWQVFPDARIVRMLRDPVETVPSTASLIRRVHGMITDRPGSPRQIADNVMDVLGNRMGIGARVLASADPRRFRDLHYEELVENPIAAVRGVYEYFGYEYGDIFENNMREWLAGNPKDKHGRHRYSLADYGLTREEVKGAFPDDC